MELLLSFVVLAGIFESCISEITDVCNGENSRLSCNNDEIIIMTSVEYGHMTVGRCITEEDQFLGCSDDVLPVFDKWCSGQRECSFSIPSDEIEKLSKHCLKFLIKYLKLEHRCVQVLSTCSHGRPTTLSSTNGHLASYMTDTKGCGTSRSPWIISANPGQTIQLDLIDFAANAQTSNLVSCRSVYGFILERALGINHTICGWRHRDAELYTSKTNFIEIHLTSKEKRGGGQFVIRYKVVGCAELKRPAHAWYKREGDEAVIGCDNNDQEWRLTCTGSTWQGEVGNCTTNGVVVPAPETPRSQSLNVSSVVIMAGIIGGAVVVSVVAIVIGAVYVNKYKMRQETKRATLHKTYATMDRNVQAYYRPVTLDQSVNRGAGLDMTLPPDPHDQMTSYPDQCTCATLQMRNQGAGDKTIGGASLERQSLYSSIKSA